jgi:hypothetical protein
MSSSLELVPRVDGAMTARALDFMLFDNPESIVTAVMNLRFSKIFTSTLDYELFCFCLPHTAGFWFSIKLKNNDQVLAWASLALKNFTYTTVEKKAFSKFSVF